MRILDVNEDGGWLVGTVETDEDGNAEAWIEVDAAGKWGPVQSFEWIGVPLRGVTVQEMVDRILAAAQPEDREMCERMAQKRKGAAQQ